MPEILLKTVIKAPADVCFDLARSIDLHKVSTAHTGEEAIAGKTEGLIELGESVTWRAKHFGVWQTLTSKVTAMERPYRFVDEMQKGAFKSFWHEHLFEENEGITTMTDRFIYTSPLGPLGNLADVLFLKAYMTNLLIVRNEVIKEYAEGGLKAEQIVNYDLHQVVIAIEDINDNIKAGTEGTIVFILSKDNFLVEFIDKDNETIDDGMTEVYIKSIKPVPNSLAK